MRVIAPVPVYQGTGLSRASTGTLFDINRVMQTAAAHVVRYSWDPRTLEFQGALWEPERTNLLLNSATLSTQTRNLSTGTQYTLSFYGSGSITLSGASATTLQGLGAYPAGGRATVTFTAAGPSLTLAVSGAVQYAQLEQGSYPTSYIPTTSAIATRAADTFSGEGMFNTTFTESMPGWSDATTYATGAVVRFGNALYESLQDGNLNHSPGAAETPAWWLHLRPSNDFAMFDRVQDTPSVGSNGAQVFAFKTLLPVNAVALLNVQADWVHIAISNGQGGLQRRSVPVKGGVALALFDAMPLPNGAVVSTFATRASGPVIIGEFVCGGSSHIGDTQYGLTTGIVDYSRKDTDEFGNTAFVKRAYSKRMNAKLLIDSTSETGGDSDLNNITALLYYLRATPTVWIASDESRYAVPSVVYGFYRDFSVEIAYPTAVLCDLEIEGLI